MCILDLFLISSGLGPTVSELDVSQHKVFPKTCFSMCVPDFQKELDNLKGEKFKKW